MTSHLVRYESHENFTLKIYEGEWNRQVQYKVDGFWAEPVTILQTKSIRSAGEIEWDAPQIFWSSGGIEKVADPADIIEAFTEALAHARETYLKWRQKSGCKA